MTVLGETQRNEEMKNKSKKQKKVFRQSIIITIYWKGKSCNKNEYNLQLRGIYFLDNWGNQVEVIFKSFVYFYLVCSYFIITLIHYSIKV